ncbi:MAG: hypothetical protein F6K42_35045 [Leptolyngbya sp. SIO1D8]|nr:hypothetical protein [Leptolyngbya sp. SIO1D8]
MIYTWSIPAHEFVDHADNELFPSSGDPFVYGAIGRKMKIKVEFRDILGYTPHLQNAEELDLEGKYFDPLISLTGLTGLQVTHTIEKSDGDLKIAIAFNPRAVVNADNPTGPVRLPRDDDGEPDSREKERVRSIRAAYMRFMQQLRDANTKYHLESSLRFAGLPASSDLRKPLSDDDRIP